MEIIAEKTTPLKQVKANFSNPLMIYSIGKDSSTILLKAYYPELQLLSLMYVDTK